MRELLARELHSTVAYHVSAMVFRAQAGRALGTRSPYCNANSVAQGRGLRRLIGRGSPRCCTDYHARPRTEFAY